MTPFYLFYEPLRILLGDNDCEQVYQFQDSALSGAVRTVFLFGRGPDGFALDGDQATAEAITPELPSGNEFAIVAYEAGLLLIGGDTGANSYRTRALSVTESGDRKRDLLAELRTKIYGIQSGDGFSTYQSFVTWVQSIGDDWRSGLQVKVPPQSTIVTLGPVSPYGIVGPYTIPFGPGGSV
jgi:hypothetical protein